ncbi:CHAT domain-containing protein [Streptomyces olivochromogenes]|uniref:CHAT domain-containing tetratricopeptide repeat protein n=1 Tax=Streptomyces olivochromogenes TaxID=1963 RepID=UPI0036DD4A9E
MPDKLSAVMARLRLVVETQDPSPVLEPEAVHEARQLAELLDGDDDLQVPYVLGWFHWYRYQALPTGEDQADLQHAAQAFMVCFVAGIEDLPEPLLPLLAAGAAPQAIQMLQEAQVSSDPDLLTATVNLWQRIAQFSPADHPDRAAVLSNLGVALGARFEQGGPATDLDAAIEAGQEAIQATPVGHPNRAATVSNLAEWLRARFERDGAVADLDAAIEAGQEAVQATPADHPDPARYLSNLGEALRARFEVGSSLADLDAVIDHFRAAVQAAPAGHPDRARHLSNLGEALRVRFKRVGAVADLDAAIDHIQEAVEAAPAGHPDRAGCLSNLGDTLLARFEQGGRVTDLDAAIEAGQEAVQAAPIGHPGRALYLSNLGEALRARSDRVGAVADLDAAVDHFRKAVQAAPASHPGRARYLTNTGITLRVRFKRGGAVAALDAAIEAGQEAVQAAPIGHPDRALCLSSLVDTLWARFEVGSSLADLDAVIDHLRAAVQAAPAGHPDRARYLSNLGEALRVRFKRVGAVADLHAAIDHLQEAAHATPTDHPKRAMYLSNLGIALQARCDANGSVADLDAAIDHLQEAAHATPIGHPDRAGYLSNLGGSLRVRFERGGAVADLDAAVNHIQEAVEAAPAGHPDRALYLSNLGGALHKRFERIGAMADLDAAIEAEQEAVEAAPVHHPDRALFLSNLGGSLRVRFERGGAVADLDAAVNHLRKAVQATLVGSPDRARYLSNLGGALQARFERGGAVADLDAAIDHLQEAAHATPTGHPDRAAMLSNLGGALRVRFERGGAVADLDAAIDHLQEAAHATPTGHPDRALYLYNLGLLLQIRFKHWGAVADRDAAVNAWLSASEVGSAAATQRIEAGLAAAGLLARSGDVERAADTAEMAVGLLPQVAPRRLERSDQQHAVGDFAGLAGVAAALALAAPGGTPSQRAERALVLLETGRAVLLSQALETRSDLTDLRDRNPELARRFAELRERLDRSADTMISTEDSKAGNAMLRRDHVVRERHRLAEEFTATLAEIRNMDGFATFALPPSIDELKTEASQGPIAVFNISPDRSDALLLTAEGVASLALPDLRMDSLIDKVNTFWQAQQLALSGADPAERETAQAVLVDVLQWLWDAAAGPVLDTLGFSGQPAAERGDDGDVWRRVWWAPGGLLGMLPIHAAGYHTDPAAHPHRRTVMDRAVSSYTPTVRALRYARERAQDHEAESSAAVQALIVAMPTTPGLDDDGRLRFVDAEAEMLQARLPGAVMLREPDPAEGPVHLTPTTPTKANVLAHLPHCAIAHFACHGSSHPDDPSKSVLLLHDHVGAPLTVGSLAPVALDQARLAYLSACRTAAIDTANLLDEAIHLASAFQLAGFRQVIGTLWEIDDQIAVVIAEAFYDGLKTDSAEVDPDRAARALHRAVRQVRDGHDLPAPFNRTQAPLLWAAHLHAGA